MHCADPLVAITADGGLNAGTGKSAGSRRSPVCCQCRRDRDHVTLVRVHRAAQAGMSWPTDESAWLRECARVRGGEAVMTGDRCVVCGAGTHRPADACARCKRILDRVETRRDASGGVRRVDAAARLRALAGSWRDGAFHCFYTGVCLIEDHSRWRDHRYLVFEDRIPGDGASVVVTCALVSRMKADLTEDRFKLIVTELAKVFNGGTFDQGAFPDQPHAGITRRPPA